MIAHINRTTVTGSCFCFTIIKISLITSIVKNIIDNREQAEIITA